MIVVERAPPYLTVQDAGRPGYRESGVPVGGAMDKWSLAMANGLVGNSRSAAALEWAIGGGALKFDADGSIAMCGAELEATLDGTTVKASQRVPIRAGQTLAIQRIVGRRFIYLAIGGGIGSPPVLGSRSTYLPAAMGGIDGRRLKTGDRILTGEANSSGEKRTPAIPDKIAPDFDANEIRAIPASKNFEIFADRTFTVSAASDRMGYRLEPDRPLDGVGASITSEPVCAGAIQVPPNGEPIVLMADSPTVGGYRIIGTLIACDIPILAQALPGRSLRFVPISVATAQDELRRRELWLAERFATA
ncbi:MAG: biotin-dependent carboxyltransferase family protein [Gemmatimonadaceae bacterium]